MPLPSLKITVLVVGLVAGLPWLRGSSTAPRGHAETPAVKAAATSDRVMLVAATSDEYRALAIPQAYKSDVEAPLRLLVFRGGLCVRDRGIIRAHTTEDPRERGAIIMEETGIAENASVAADGSVAVVVSTRYISRVDITPGTTSVAGDTVKSETTLTLVDPAHPDGRWQVKLEGGRWVGEIVVFPASGGLAVTTFVPRQGPFDFRILDISGRERVRVPETSGEAIRMESAPGGGFAAAEMAFREGAAPWDRGVTIFDLAKGTRWTYGWRYGSDDEPLSWTVQAHGILTLKLSGSTRRFDPTGRRL